ncbi:hypothetical protein R1sor_009277 [Riccia sorocarpa]|uniref:Replitron HUH endonuclease domain-containing protein n=1 Tax=Riccia sorocarpa TaxID=122646 RepID=A0ABD3HYR6_9MARC
MKPPLKKMKSITGACSQPKTVSRDPPKAVPKRRKAAAVKRLELSVTISVAGADISPRIFPSVQDFLHNHCQAGVYVKKLSNKGIHTFVGMVGYCLKDRKELHFRVCMKDISDAVQREGMLLYIFYGAADLKNRVELNPSNVMQRALQYNKFVSHHPLGTSFQGCIRRMLVGGHYTPSTGWLINKGMDLTRMTSMWRVYLQPGALTMADVKNIFFWMPRQYPSLFIEGVHPGLQLLKTSVLEDLRDSDHSPFQTERVSGNSAAHSVASFIPLVPGNSFHLISLCLSCFQQFNCSSLFCRRYRAASDRELQADSSDRPLEGIGSNCLCC